MPSDEMLRLFESSSRVCPTCQHETRPSGNVPPVVSTFSEAYPHNICLCTNCGELLFDEDGRLRKPTPLETIYALFEHWHVQQAQMFIRMRSRMDV